MACTLTLRVSFSVSILISSAIIPSSVAFNSTSRDIEIPGATEA